jgi:hypothetical protein
MDEMLQDIDTLDLLIDVSSGGLRYSDESAYPIGLWYETNGNIWVQYKMLIQSLELKKELRDIKGVQLVEGIDYKYKKDLQIYTIMHCLDPNTNERSIILIEPTGIYLDDNSIYLSQLGLIKFLAYTRTISTKRFARWWDKIFTLFEQIGTNYPQNILIKLISDMSKAHEENACMQITE